MLKTFDTGIEWTETMKIVFLILSVTFFISRIQHAEGTCTIDLTLNIPAGKMDLNLDCPSCGFPEKTLDFEDCDISSDLKVKRNCSGDGCRRSYYLLNTSNYPMCTECPTGTTADNIYTEEGTQCLLIVSSMGALSGFLLILLAFMTLGWAWTCWKLKRLSRRKIRVRVNDYVDTTPELRLEENENTSDLQYDDLRENVSSNVTNEQYDVPKLSLETIDNNNYNVAKEQNIPDELYDSIPNTLAAEESETGKENQPVDSVCDTYAFPKKYRSTQTITNDTYDTAIESHTSETVNDLYAIPRKYRSTEMLKDDTRQEEYFDDPTYDKIMFTYSLPSEIDATSGEAITSKRQKPRDNEDKTEPYDVPNKENSSEMTNIHYDIVTKKPVAPQEPTYAKIRRSNSVRADADVDVDGLSDAASTKKLMMVKPPIKYNETGEEQDVNKDTVC